MKKTILIIFGILLLVSVIFNASLPIIKNRIEKDMRDGKITIDDLPIPKQNNEEKIRNAVKAVVDDKHLKEISVIPLDSGKYNLTVAFYVDDSQDLAVSSVKLKTTEVFASLFIKDLGVNEVWTFAWYPFQDTNNNMVLKSRMNKELADKASHESKMAFQYDAERIMIIEKSSYSELPVSTPTP